MSTLLTIYAHEGDKRVLYVSDDAQDYRFCFDDLDDLHDTLEAACIKHGLAPSACTAALMDAKRYIEEDFFAPRWFDDDERIQPADFSTAFQWFSAWALVGLAAGVLLWGLRQ